MHTLFPSLALAALGLASTSSAQTARYCPSTAENICYSVNVPDTTASSGTGDLFFQIRGPRSNQWIALGQGRQMSDSNIFVIYSSADGNNVTLSPRAGMGHVEPKYDAGVQAFLLQGSGIDNGVMTANVRCQNCNRWSSDSMDLSSSSTAWIWASRSGSPLNTDDTGADIRQHDANDRFTLDLTRARGGNSLNPFIAPANYPSSTVSADGAGQTQVAGSAKSGESGTVKSASGSRKQKSSRMLFAHGILMSLAFVIFFPLGAFIIRLLGSRSKIWAHGGTQFFAFCLAIAGMGLGVWLTQNQKGEIAHYHPIIGLTVLVALLVQLILGHVHLILQQKSQKRTFWSDIHEWWGRATITLGIINGGLGLKWASNTRGGEIAYGVVGVVVWVAWIAVGAWSDVKRLRKGSRSGSTQGEKGLLGKGDQNGSQEPRRQS